MLGQTSDNNKRIAKNTLFLYFRMLFLMAVSLYTSRVILNALGVEDYGIYNVVGGVVAMFSVLSGSLSSAISRFITYELGRGNSSRLKDIFSSAVTIQVVLSGIIIILAETIGIWFLNYKMVIPAERLVAANWVYQFSIVTFAINLISLPYNASIIAHEKMSAFAYISILEALGKLIVAWAILVSPIDRLIFFSGLVAVIAWLIRMVYARYCKSNFEECHYSIKIEKNIFKEMLGFAGWNFIGSSSAIIRDQCGSILINLFFGPTVNAARAVSSRVNSAITGFVQNFMTALNPQITKSYATGQKDYMFKLVFQGARLSYYILLILSLPVLLNTHYILVIWLNIVPEYTVIFIQLTLIFAMSESISNPLITATQATGKIKKYQLIVGGLQMLNIPIAYIILKLGGKPESVLYVAIVISQCCLVARLIILKDLIELQIRPYIVKVYANVFIVTIISAILPYYLSYTLEESLVSFLIISSISVASTIAVEFFIGCNSQERSLIKKYIQRFTKKQNNDTNN